MKIRALAIAFFYAAGTAVGGLGAPFLFGALIQTGSRASVFGVIWGVASERKPLEAVARPLSTD